VTAGRDLGERFARSLAAKDRAALLALLADPIDFKALTPRASWDADHPADVVDRVVLGHWFEPDDHIEELLHVTADRVGDRDHVAYRLRVRSGSGHYLVEQQVYYGVVHDRIGWLRILCSGFRPLTERPELGSQDEDRQ
jgi:hypothetical protein